MTIAISNLNSEEIVRTFYKRELQKTNQNECKVEKVIERKGGKLYVKWKGYDNYFNSWIDKKGIVYMSEYFPKPKFLEGNVQVELDLCNCATKADLKNAAGIDTSKFAIKVDLTSLKSENDKTDIGKLEKIPTDVNSLRNKVNKLDVDELNPATCS